MLILLHSLALGVLVAPLPCTAEAASQPPVGAVYTRTISLPVIGKQTVELSILSKGLARIVLSGRMLNVDEPVTYTFVDGRLSFELSEETKRTLRRFRTSLEGAGYDGELDESWVVVWPPLPLSVRIRLKRAQGASCRRLPQLSFGWGARSRAAPSAAPRA